jgi:hypothetical protein
MLNIGLGHSPGIHNQDTTHDAYVVARQSNQPFDENDLGIGRVVEYNHVTTAKIADVLAARCEYMIAY